MSKRPKLLKRITKNSKAIYVSILNMKLSLTEVHCSCCVHWFLSWSKCEHHTLYNRILDK